MRLGLLASYGDVTHHNLSPLLPRQQGYSLWLIAITAEHLCADTYCARTVR